MIEKKRKTLEELLGSSPAASFEEQKKDENLFTKPKIEEKKKAEPKAETPTLSAANSFSAKMIEEFSLSPEKEKNLGIGTVEGIGFRFWKKIGAANIEKEKSIELWIDPEEKNQNLLLEKYISRGFSYSILRAVRMEKDREKMITVSIDRRTPFRAGSRVIVYGISKNGWANFRAILAPKIEEEEQEDE